MSDKDKIMFAIVRFLKDQLEGGELSEDQVEGVSIGIQCLESAYNIQPSDLALQVPCGLEGIFAKHISECELNHAWDEETLYQAESLKEEGNRHMSDLMFKEAIDCYTRAINLNPRNVYYYCNRAAAYNNIKEHDSAIKDCQSALRLNDKYHKAYARLGAAYVGKSQFKEAVINYKKAVDLQPENVGYHRCLEAALEKESQNLFNASININLNGASTSFNLPDINTLSSFFDNWTDRL